VEEGGYIDGQSGGRRLYNTLWITTVVKSTHPGVISENTQVLLW
jgi:hypothetical protein